MKALTSRQAAILRKTESLEADLSFLQSAQGLCTDDTALELRAAVINNIETAKTALALKLQKTQDRLSFYDGMVDGDGSSIVTNPNTGGNESTEKEDSLSVLRVDAAAAVTDS